jgi:hypothetical protein
MSKKLSTSYSLVEYNDMFSKVKILCKIHGVFYQNPVDHLQGKGCKKCSGNEKLTKVIFIKRSNEIHHNKYDYSEVNYKNIDSKVIIKCPIHGEFKQSPYKHMLGQGCSKCKKVNKLNLQDFINKAKEIHNNKYNYSKVNYKNIDSKIEIICPKHGSFKQTPYNHLKGFGCSRCSVRISKNETKWLNSLNVKERNVFIKTNLSYYYVDGYDSETNTIYEFNGDFWHGNPKIYDQNKIAFSKNTFGMLYKNTIKKKKALEKAGYKVISIWESEFDSKANIKE